jgi:hypothetical protein
VNAYERHEQQKRNGQPWLGTCPNDCGALYLFPTVKRCPRCHPLGWWRLIDVAIGGLFIGTAMWLL